MKRTHTFLVPAVEGTHPVVTSPGTLALSLVVEVQRKMSGAKAPELFQQEIREGVFVYDVLTEKFVRVEKKKPFPELTANHKVVPMAEARQKAEVQKHVREERDRLAKARREWEMLESDPMYLARQDP